MARTQDLESLRLSLSWQANVAAPGDKIYGDLSARWSDLYAPDPSAVISVATENDVAAAVKWATSRGIPFMAQSGGHAWGDWFTGVHKGGGVVINMRRLNSVRVDAEQGVAVIGGGCIIKEVLVEAKKARVHVAIGTCNTVGAIPSITGGGLGFTMPTWRPSRVLPQGMYGCGVDNMVSARIVTADGELRTVSSSPASPEDSELWWGLRGAATGLGVVTSLTVRAYPEVNGGQHYSAMVALPGRGPGSGLEEAVRTATSETSLPLAEDAGLAVLFMRGPPPEAAPMLALSLWHARGREAARAAFKPVFDMDLVVLAEGELPYDTINDGLDMFCYKGGFKPGWGLSVNEIDTAALAKVWEDWVTFSALPGAGASMINIERYSMARTHAVAAADAAVGPALRERALHAFVCTMYDDPALHDRAAEVGRRFRQLLSHEGDEPGKKHIVYANFSSGDEQPDQIYGSEDKLRSLRELKRQWDPKGVFSHFASSQ